MCGIVGYSGFDHNTVDIRSLADIQRHRGPDDRGSILFEEHRIALGHLRLAIQDLSPAGHQPMQTQSGSTVIVYNGEIYNTPELMAELRADGVTFRGHSDTEMLLYLYEKYGERMLSKLNGIFAFAIWDKKTTELFVARDQLGVKPLYYVADGNRFAFASEMKALLRGNLVAKTLDPHAVLSHLGLLWSPGARTLVSAIKKLEPGHAMRIKDGRITRLWRYYDLPFNQPALAISEQQAADMVAGAVETAVKRQLLSDVPVGAFLSGGLDSSSVVAYARQAMPDTRIQCFTIDVRDGSVAEEGFASDLPYAKRVADHLGVDLHTVEVGPEMADRLQEMIYFLDEPTADPAALNALFISELARQHNITVLLSGSGGDDIFTGYRRHYALQQERYWSWLPAPARSALASVAGALPASSPTLRRISKALQYADKDAAERLTSYFLWLAPSGALGLLNRDFAAGLDVGSLTAPLLSTLSNLPADTSALNQMLYLECKHFLADHNLNYTDKMGMAAGIEVRVPLLDLELVDLAARLPLDYKQRGREGKWIFKKAMERMLPHDVIYRPKTGFGVPLRAWLRGRLRPLVDDALSAASISKRGIFDAKAVAALRRADEDKRVDGTYALFAVVCLELWCRQYLDGQYPV
nr:asparagine synthase (glutamine-hydrolyzing) [uncultured Ralstonia sp.]